MDELYKQEVLELTELLKNDEEWEDLRNILIQKGFNLSKTVLVSFVEDDKGNEYGAEHHIQRPRAVLKFL